MKLLLIRHAIKIKGIGDVSISSAGKRQAILTGTYFKGDHFDALFSSAQKRSIETAHIIGKFIDTEPQISKLLNERISFGDIPNQSYQDYLELCRKSSLYRSYLLPNGETSISAGRRFESLIMPFYDTNKNILIVSHGGVIVDYLRNIFPDELLISKSLYFSKYLMVNYCSLTEVEVLNNKKTLLQVGSITHLNQSEKYVRAPKNN